MDDKDLIQKDPFDILKSIGIEKISSQTHIDERVIKNILDKRLDRLGGVNLKGFLKIIQREFDVDLAPEFFRSSQTKAIKQPPRRKVRNIDPKINKKIRQNIDRINVNQKTNKGGGSKILGVIILIAILVGFIFYFRLYEVFSFFDNSVNEKEANYSNVSIVSKAEKNLESIGVDVPKFDSNKTLIKDENSSTNLKRVEDNKKENKENNSNEIEIKNEEEAIKNEKQSLESDKKALKESEDTLKEIELKNNEIYPREKMWLGAIELKTGRKITRSISEPFLIDVKKDQLILTGHGYFKIKINGKTETFDTKTPIRFYIKNGKISKIDYDEFVKLNKGKAW